MWWWIAAFVVSLVATYFLMPKPEIAEVPEVQEVDIPTVEDGKTIPVLFGTRDTEAFNVVWWGDVNTRNFDVSGGESTWYRDVENVHGGYRYFLGLHAVLFHGPIDHITMVKSDDKIAWTGEQADGTICDIGSIELYGDVDAEGGFGERTINWDDGDGDWPSDGCLEILMGYPDQERNWYLEHNLDGGDAVGDTDAHEIPAFRGVVSAVFNRFYIGNSPQLRKILFRGQRIHVRQDGIAQWYDEKSEIPFYCGSVPTPNPEIDSINLAFSIEGGQSALDNGVWTSSKETIASFFEWLRDEYLPVNPTVKFSSYVNSFNQTAATSVPNSSATLVLTNSISAINTFIADIRLLEAEALAGDKPHFCSQNYRYAHTAAGFLSEIDSRNPSFSFLIGGNDPKYLANEVVPTCEGVTYSETPLETAQAGSDLLDTEETIRPLILWYSVLINTYEENYARLLDRDTPEDEDLKSSFEGSPVGLIEAISPYILADNSNVGASALSLNPAHIIRECITDPDWGEGSAETLPDESAFTYAADTLYEEGMGISIKWTAQTSIDDFIDLIKKHINAELYTDHATGKKILKLIRDDYVIADLDIYGEDEIVKVENAKRPMIGELINSVTVQYWDICTGKDASVTVQDQALVSLQGGQVNTTIQYPGFTHRSIAVRVATRDLRALASQLLTCTIYVNRTAENLNLGSVFVFYWPDLEIDGIVMRVQGIDFGDGRSNTIKLDVIEDVFGLPATVVVEDDDNDPVWTNPSQPPAPVDYQIAAETPYYSLVKVLGQAEVATVLSADSGAGYASVGAVRSGNALNAIMAVDSGSGYIDEGTMNFCSTLTLLEAVDQIDKVWNYDTAIDVSLFTSGSFAQIEDELVRIDSIDTTTETISVGRAVLDTSPRSHAAGARLYGWGANNRRSVTQYTDSDSINIKVKTVTGKGTLDIAYAPFETVALDSRAIRPYPAGDIKIDGVSYPTALIEDDIAVTWAYRDRLTQIDDNLVDHANPADYGPENGTTYTLYIIDGEGTTKLTYSGVSSASQTIIVDTLSNDDYILQIWAVRDGYFSTQCVEWEFSLYLESAPLFSGTIANMEATKTVAFTYDASIHFTSGKYALSNAPSWMTIDENTGVISGVPDVSELTENVVVTASNYNGSASSNSFSVLVSNLVVSGNYWRVYILDNNGDANYIQIGEVEMRTTLGGANACTGGSCSVSSVGGGSNFCTYALDGIWNTYWSSNGVTNQWWKYSFPSAVAIVQIAIESPNKLPANGAPKNMRIEYSTDNINWDVYATIPAQTNWGFNETRVFDL